MTNAIFESSTRGSGFFESSKQRLRYAVDCDKPDCAVVSTLCFARRSPDISGTISALIVDAIDRQVRGWARTNFGKESIEIAAPLWAYRDAASAVILEGVIARIFAPLNHVLPDFVFRRFRLPVCPVLIGPYCGMDFVRQAPA